MSRSATLGFEVFHPDVEVPARFYLEVLGFEKVDPDHGADYCAVARDGIVVGCSRHPEAPLVDRRPPSGSEIVLRVPDVHAELERVERAGWPLADALQERPWGQTDFRLLDPSGQYIRVTSRG